MEKISTEEVMGKVDMFQSRFGIIDKFEWWDLERILADAGTQFTLMEFKDECQTCSVNFTLASLEHQEINGQVKLIQRTLRTITHSLMVFVRVLKAYIIVSLIYMANNFFRYYQSKI